MTAVGQRIGVGYLEGLDRFAFGAAHEGPALFVDEYELLARHDREKTGSPDQAVLWPDRVLIIELKTERTSHRAGQCEHYLDLGVHHNPGLQVDLIYLPGPMPPWSPQPPAVGTRTAHLSWAQALTLIDQVWGQAPPPSGTSPGSWAGSWLT